MIKAIELKNWKTHGSTRLSFSKGTNIIVGQMGAGKSSIMDAISFALFGNFPALQHRRTGVNKLIRNKPKQQKKGLVRLEFTSGNDEYAVTREINFNGTTSAKLEKNGSYFQSQPERVTEEIERALKIDYDLFSKAVYSEQNNLEYFIGLRAGERKAEIDRLLGLDRFAVAQENTISLANKLKDMVEEGARLAEGFDIERARAQLDEIVKEHNRLITEKSAIEQSIKKLDSDERALSEKLEAAKKEYSRKILLQKEIAELRSRSSTLQSEIEKIERQGLGTRAEAQGSYDTLNNKLSKLSESEKRALERERKAISSAAMTQAGIENTQKEEGEKAKLTDEAKRKSRADLEKRVKELNSEMEKLNEEIAKCRSVIGDNEKWLKELQGHIQKCPVCERELTEEIISKLKHGKKEAFDRARLEIANHEKAVAAHRADVNALTQELNRLSAVEERLSSFGDLEARMAQLRKELAAANDDLRTAKAERDESSKAALAARDEIARIKSSLEALTRLEGYLADKKKNDKAIDEKQSLHDSITADERAVDSLQKEVTALASSVSKLKADLDSKAVYLKDKERQLKEKEEEISRINRIHEDLKTKKATIDNLGKFRASLEETQAFMRSRLIGSINEIMNRMWPELYPYGDYPGIVLEASGTDYALKVKTNIDGEFAWEEVQSIASGGERSTACLAMRIAFAMVLVPNLRWLILDEPTHNIDRQGLSKFIHVFNETLPRHIDQVFIITHDEMLKQVENARIYTLNRNKEENKETEVMEA